MPSESLPPITAATIAWVPASPNPPTVEARGPEGAMLLLLPEQQEQVLEAFIATAAPRVPAALQGYAMIGQLLAYVVKRLEHDGELVAHPDGEPVVPARWLEAAKAMLEGTDGD